MSFAEAPKIVRNSSSAEAAKADDPPAASMISVLPLLTNVLISNRAASVNLNAVVPVKNRPRELPEGFLRPAWH